MSNDLHKRDIETIHAIFSKYPDIERVFLFGSRALDTFQPGSDIDLAVMNNNVNSNTICKLKSDFEESTLPYFVDVVLFTEIKDIAFKEHITRVGKVFYSK